MMSRAYYPFKHSSKTHRRKDEDTRHSAYFEQAFTALKQHPERVARIKENLAHYQQQAHLPKSAQAAIKRFEYLLAVTSDPFEMERWVMEDSYEGKKFRQLPLIFKGVGDD